MKKDERQLLKTNGSAESDEYKKLMILIIIIAIVFGLLYVFTTVLTKKKDNKDSIFKNDLDPSEIQYKEIIIGGMFDKDGEYYVLLVEDNDPYKAAFDKTISSVTSDNKVYTVDLNSAFNKKYLSDENNYDEDDFKVKGTLLVKIDNHEIVDHYEDKDEILSKLGSLTR